MNKNINIFIGPHEVAGFYQNLKYGFDELGVSCDLIFFTPHKFGYDKGNDYPLLIKISRKLHEISSDISFEPIVYFLKFIRTFITSLWGLYAIFHYDSFIFGFGRTLLPRNLDLIILRLLKKKVIVNIAHGSDARPPYMNGYLNLGCRDLKKIKKKTVQVRQKVTRIERFSSLVIGSPCSSSQFLEKPFINTFSIGAPFHDKSFPICREDKLSDKVRILHAPSNFRAKGSDIIFKAIKSLQEKGFPIEFVKIENRPHAQVLDEISHSDIIVDQLYSDTPMAGFPSEAAWYGKPSVVGGYSFEFLRPFVQTERWPPTKTCHPDNIQEAIMDLIVNKEERRDIGVAAYNFIREVRSAKSVASNYLKLVNDDYDRGWLIDPLKLQYVLGAGQSVEKTQETVKALISQYGTSALQLGHNKTLEKKFVDLARGLL